MAEQIDRVPRTPEEKGALLYAKPEGWEYLLFASLLLEKKRELEPRWEAHLARRRSDSGEDLTGQEAIERLGRAFPDAREIISRLDLAMTPETQERAFGKPGEAGDVTAITEFAEAVITPYSEFLDWADALRSANPPTPFRASFDALAEFAEQPTRQLRAYVDDVVKQFDDLPAAIREKRPIDIRLILTPSIDQEVAKRFEREYERAGIELSRQADELDQRADELEKQSAQFPASAPAAPAGKGMFGKWRAGRAEKHLEAALAEWQHERDACLERLDLAQHFAGDTTSDQLLLKRGEGLFATISGTSLVEDRRGAGKWEGRSSGFSLPVASIGGRSIRYRTGRTRGHYVQGAPVATAIDVGTLLLTNQRVIFHGSRQTRECRFDKLVGFEHSADGSTVFSVSNRQKSTTVHYGPEIAGWFDLRLDLALAHYHGDVAPIVAQLESDLATLDQQKPAAG